jgi:hypothetical protein
VPVPILVVQRAWPQQENPARPLLPADAPAVLAGRVATATTTHATDVPRAIEELVAVVAAQARSLGLDADEGVLAEVASHALTANRDAPAELRLVVADLGGESLTYALVTPLVTPLMTPLMTPKPL